MKNIIIENGPILSSDIINIATSNNPSLSQEAARKRLSRIDGNIYKLRGLFSDRQILFYSTNLYPSERYYTGLRDALKKAGKQYYTIIQSLEFHSGYMKKDELASYSVNTVQPLTGHVTFDSALTKLQQIGLVSIVDDYIVLFEGISDGINNLHRSKGIEIAKNFLLTQFNEWSRNIGLVSFNSAKYYSEFGKYQFNFVASSYIGTLPKKTVKKSVVPGFVVADCLIYNTINEKQIEFLINKVSALKAQKNIANFIPFLIVDSMDTQALNKLKSSGIVIAFVHELFGSKYKDLLHSLINLVTNAGAILKNNPDEYLNIVSSLNKLVEGKTNNLRGDLFELAVGYYQGRMCQSIDIGKSILTEEGMREIDVFGVTNDKIFVCECKGYNHKVTKEEIEKWLGKNIPIIRKWLLAQEVYSHKKLIFEFWSTGGFTDDALSLLCERKANTTKYSIEYYDLDQIIKKSKEAGSTKFTEIIRDYYIKEI